MPEIPLKYPNEYIVFVFRHAWLEFIGLAISTALFFIAIAIKNGAAYLNPMSIGASWVLVCINAIFFFKKFETVGVKNLVEQVKAQATVKENLILLPPYPMPGDLFEKACKTIVDIMCVPETERQEAIISLADMLTKQAESNKAEFLAWCDSIRIKPE